jgi:queuine tRNA-ribosyltransferase
MATQARVRKFELGRLSIETPLFMPVGTRATVRGQNLDDLAVLGFPVLLANTYHLGLRPGPEVLQLHGGVKPWMDWSGSVLTDSGGYQVFSLSDRCEINEEGALFRSILDGAKIHLTPERSMQWQGAIDSDIRMVMDQCVPSTVGISVAREAMLRTHRWAARSKKAHAALNDGSDLFAILQGACFTELRKQSALALAEMDFSGFAIGGLAVGESRQEREDITEFTAALLPSDKPRYLMGVGTPLDILEAVHRGVDMFDCILPTAMAQHGVAYTSRGKVDLKRGIYKLSQSPLDPECECRTCVKFSRSYLHHLVRVGECMGWQHVAHHNFAFYQKLILQMRGAIQAGVFESLYSGLRPVLGQVDLENPSVIPQKKHQGPSTKTDNFEVIVAKNQHWTVRELSHGEAMHPGAEGLRESERLYVEQTQLKQRLETPSRPLVIWDVGLGIAANAMAVVDCWNRCQPRRDLVLVSVDTTLEPLQLAVKHQRRFPHLWNPLPKKVLADKSAWALHPVTGTRLDWTVHEVDFYEKISEFPKPDFIFYDPFSHKVNPELWTEAKFAQIYNQVRGTECELVTYSNSTSVRTAMLLAGFFVGRGCSSAEKSETTVAFTMAESGSRHSGLLDSQWLDKWMRSSAFLPPLGEYDRPELSTKLQAHPQFVT